MVRVALAPCSPFSVTRELMAEAAELARRRGVRLHTHLAETLDEEEFCRERFGMRPVEYLGELGWLGDDVWLAHCVHLSDDEVEHFGATGTGVAHCPSSNARLGAGIAPVAALARAGAPVGLGVDGAASNEAGGLAIELRQALLFARLAGGPAALSAREALALGTIHGARCLGRDDELGSLEPGKLADVALWRLDGVDHAGIEDPVAALVLGPPRPVDTLIVGGGAIVRDGELRTAGEEQLAQDLERASRRLAGWRQRDDHPRRRRPDPRASRRAGPAPQRGRRHDHAHRRRPEGQGRVRVLVGHARRGDAVGRDAAQPAPARGHLVDRHLARAGHPRRARRADPRGCARAQGLRHGGPRPAGAGRVTCATRARRSRSSRPTSPRRLAGRSTPSRSTTRCSSR